MPLKLYLLLLNILTLSFCASAQYSYYSPGRSMASYSNGASLAFSPQAVNSSLAMSAAEDAGAAGAFVPSGGQKFVRKSTDVLLIAMPVATLAGVLIAQDWEGLKEGALTAAVTAGSTLLLKYTIGEKRPDGSNYRSFPSGHTSTTFATATFLQRRYGWKFGVPAYILSTYVAWGRVYGKKHHWWDVVAGAAIGAGSALIFTHPWAKEHNLSIAPVSDGENIGLTTYFEF